LKLFLEAMSPSMTPARQVTKEDNGLTITIKVDEA